MSAFLQTICFFLCLGFSGPLMSAEPSTERVWTSIVIHHSATEQGSVASIHRHHLQKVDSNGQPWKGIGYHFVIGNGQGMKDGQVEATFRWDEQSAGAHAGQRDYNEHGIGICLIGNFDRHKPTAAQMQALKELINRLCREEEIPRSKILKHQTIKATNCPGKYFPWDQIANRADVLRSTRITTLPAEDSSPDLVSPPNRISSRPFSTDR